MNKFRLPRKIKKKIKRSLYLYPQNEVDKTYMATFPKENQEDYEAYKRGELTDPLEWVKNKNYEKVENNSY